MNSSLNPEINKVNLYTNFFDQLKRNASYEAVNYNNGNLALPMKPENQADKTIIETSRLIHSGDQIFNKIPFEINNSRPLFDYSDGRNLDLLNNLNQNSTNNRSVVYHQGQGGLGFLG